MIYCLTGILVFLTVYSGVFVFAGRRCRSLREAAVIAAVSLAAFAVVLSEAASLAATGPSFLPYFRGGWYLAALFSAFQVFFMRASLLPLAERFRLRCRQLACEPGLLKWVIAGLLLVTFAVALLAPPSDQDALSYHLPRALHWISSGSIEHFPTAVARQNYQPPAFSMAVMSLFALTGTSLLVNLIQWASALLSAAAVSLIARECGASRRGQITAAFLALAMPSVLSQSVASVNDIFSALPFCLFVLGMMRFIRRKSFADVLMVALGAGVAAASKSTTAFFTAVCGLWFGVVCLVSEWRRYGLFASARAFARLSAAALLALPLSLPYLWRNYTSYGDFLSGETGGYTLPSLSFSLFRANLSQHICSFFSTPSGALNTLVERLFRVIGGPEFASEQTLYSGYNGGPVAFHLTLGTVGRNTSLASSELHFFAFAVFAALCFAMPRKRRMDLLRFVIPVLLSFGLYCLVFRWQLWSARLFIPLFLLASAGLGKWISEMAAFGSRAICFCTGLYALAHLALRPVYYVPPCVYGAQEVEGPVPLRSRIASALKGATPCEIPENAPEEARRGYSLLFTDRLRQSFGNEYSEDGGYLYGQFTEAWRFVEASAASGEIGLMISSDNGNTPPERGVPFCSEYLFWKAAGNDTGLQKGRRFVHVLPGSASLPDLIISDKTRDASLSSSHKMVFENGLFSIFAR